MIPLLPSSPLVRSTRFVSEEWQTYFAESAVDPASKVVGGWKGLLYANLAIIDPVTSFRFFSSNSFNSSWLDGGASRTWYLAFAAGMFIRTEVISRSDFSRSGRCSLVSSLRCSEWGLEMDLWPASGRQSLMRQHSLVLLDRTTISCTSLVDIYLFGFVLGESVETTGVQSHSAT